MFFADDKKKDDKSNDNKSRLESKVVSETTWKETFESEFKEVEAQMSSLKAPFTSFLDTFKKTSRGLNEALVDITTVANLFNNTISGNRTRLQEFRNAAAEAIPEVNKLGGNAADVSRTLNEIAEASRRNVVGTKEDVGNLYAASKVLDISSKELVENFANVGVQFSNIGKQVSSSVSYIRDIGGNAKQVMADVKTNIEKLNQYNFQGGVLGLTKMAAQASLMRIDMNQTFELANKAMKPEGAIEMAAAFQRLGIASGDLVDPFQLMNKSINDPGGLQNSLIEATKQFSYFDEETKTFKINPQGILTLREIGEQTGLNAAELSKASLAAADLDRKLSSISPNIDIPEEDKKYLANIARMGEDGEYRISIGDDQIRLEEATQDQLKALIKEQKEGPKDIKEIQEQQLKSIDKMAYDTAASTNKLVYGAVSVRDIGKAQDSFGKAGRIITKTIAGEVPEVKEVRNFLQEGIDSLKGVLKDPTNQKAQQKLLEDLAIKFETLTTKGIDIGSGLLPKIYENLKKGGSIDEKTNKEFMKTLENWLTKLDSSIGKTPVTNAKDVIVTENGNIKTDPSDIITAFKPGGIIAALMSNKEFDKNNERDSLNINNNFDTLISRFNKTTENTNKDKISVDYDFNTPLINYVYNPINRLTEALTLKNTNQNNLNNDITRKESIPVKIDTTTIDNLTNTVNNFMSEMKNLKSISNTKEIKTILNEVNSEIKKAEVVKENIYERPQSINAIQKENIDKKISETTTTTNTTSTTNANQNVNFGGTVTFKIDAPPGVSVQYLTEYVNSERFKESIYSAWKEKQVQKEINV